MDPASIFDRADDDHLFVIGELRPQRAILEPIAIEMARAISSGRKILWCGSGSSAADCQHLAAKLAARFRPERSGLPSIDRTTDTSALTAISNDCRRNHVFSRQVEAMCTEGDVEVGISACGSSRNVFLTLESLHRLDAYTVALTGESGRALAVLADAVLYVPSKDTARVQGAHILCGHMLCDWVERSISEIAATKQEAACR